jgi:hypothetical protein
MTTAPTDPRPAREQHTRAPGYADDKADHLARLNKMEGQTRGCVTDADRTDPAQAEEKFAECSGGHALPSSRWWRRLPFWSTTKRPPPFRSRPPDS